MPMLLVRQFLGGKTMRTLLAIALFLLTGSTLAQEKLSGSNVDVRTVLAFRAPDTAVQRLLPEGWEVNSPTTGPARGSNVSLVLVNQVVAQDSEGKPVSPSRGVALVVPARKKGTDTTGAMVVGGLFSPDAAPGVYGVFLPASVVINRRERIEVEGKIGVDESWEFKGADGHAIEVQVQYDRGVPARGKSELKVFSGVKPDFFRIYRTDSVTDVARSTATGVDRVSRVSLKATGRKFAPIFDGTEQLISVTSIPSYSRQVFLPGP